jgi:hypothetical protein
MTATVEGTKLELLQAKEAELAIAVDEARARVAAYPDQLHEARSRAIYAKPNVRPGAELNSEVSKLNAKEKKDLDRLRALEADLAACRGVLAIEAQRVTEEATAEAREQLEQLHVREESVWSRGGELIGQLAGVWNDLVTVVEEESQLAAANGLDSHIPAVEPVPANFKMFLSLLRVVALDPEVRAAPHSEQIVDSGIYGRRDAEGNSIGGATYDTRVVGTREIEVRRRLDRDDRLIHLVPDLRDVVRRIGPLGHVPTLTSE